MRSGSTRAWTSSSCRNRSRWIWARGRFVRGGSTITQQLAKNLYLSPSKNPLRKLRELVIARRLEAELKKARILELYLNVIEWGDGIYGVEAAARAYFHTSAPRRSAPSESALLAGAIVNPRMLNPAKPDAARLLRRQQLILKRMGAVTAARSRRSAQLVNADERNSAPFSLTLEIASLSASTAASTIDRDALSAADACSARAGDSRRDA